MYQQPSLSRGNALVKTLAFFSFLLALVGMAMNFLRFTYDPSCNEYLFTGYIFPQGQILTYVLIFIAPYFLFWIYSIAFAKRSGTGFMLSIIFFIMVFKNAYPLFFGTSSMDGFSLLTNAIPAIFWLVIALLSLNRFSTKKIIMILMTVYIALSVLLFGMMIFTTIRSFAGIDIGMSTHVGALSSAFSTIKILSGALFGIAASILVRNNRLAY
jgi:hypothetical protein